MYGLPKVNYKTVQNKTSLALNVEVISCSSFLRKFVPLLKIKNMPIQFFTEKTDFKLTQKQVIKNWIKQIIISETKRVGEVSYIFCNDEYLQEINEIYLHHTSLTDIITFDYTEGKMISGDIFISVERVKENAAKFNVAFENELLRVLAHGVLHLMGYKDKKTDEKKQMREMEEKSIALFFELEK